MARQTVKTTAQEIVDALVQNSRDYQSRRIAWEDFNARQYATWSRTAGRDLLHRAVLSLLRDVQWT